MAKRVNWTAESDTAFIHKLGFDFIAQIEKRMRDSGVSQVKLAGVLGISEGAISKMLNNPQNLTLKTIAKYSKALGIKASIVAYNDEDPANNKGLIPSEIFSACWESAGKPRDFWEFKDFTQKSATTLLARTSFYPLINWAVCPIVATGLPYAGQPAHLTTFNFQLVEEIPHA